MILVRDFSGFQDLCLKIGMEGSWDFSLFGAISSSFSFQDRFFVDLLAGSPDLIIEDLELPFRIAGSLFKEFDIGWIESGSQ